MVTGDATGMISLAGAFDLHLHSSPCLFPRLCDDFAAADCARELGMSGIALKCHHEPTTSRALAVARAAQGLEVYGGIVLNDYVGGVNPCAVEAALKTGGRFVWMPTIDSAHHIEVHGARGVYDVQVASTAAGGQGPGVTVLAGGELTSEARAVLELCRDQDAVLGTSHLSIEEIRALVAAAGEMGFDRMVITHPLFRVPRLSIEQLAQFCALGAMAEFGYCTVSPMWAYAKIGDVLAAIRAVGPERSLLVSDGGQRHNPLPGEGLRVFAQCLHEKGLAKDELRTILVDNPRRILGL